MQLRATESLPTDPAILAYAAGLIDGEGSVTLKKSKGRRLNTVRLSLSNTCRALTDFMADHFGGKVYDSPSRLNRKPQFVWVVHGQQAIAILVAVRPYLRDTRRIVRAGIAIDRILPLMRFRGAPLSPAAREERIRAEVDFLAA